MLQPHMKSVVIGNGCVGKTSLLITHVTGKFPAVYRPTVVDTDYRHYLVDGRGVIVSFWDTGGGEDYHRLRPLCYPGTHVFILCYSIGERTTFDCIPDEWIPEVRARCPDVPIVLMGCKQDLRESSPATCVPLEEAMKKANEWKMAGYFETSALSNEGIVVAFKQCLRIGYNYLLTAEGKPLTVNRARRCFSRRKRQPPGLPLEDPQPAIENEPSTFAEDWLAAFKAQEHSDVIFVLTGGNKLRAHKIVLSATSLLFAELIDHPELCSGASSLGISSLQVSPEDAGNATLTIVLDNDIQELALRHCLQFLYTGGLPDLDPADDPGCVDQLLSLSQRWRLDLLETVCTNILNDEAFLNPSVAVAHNTATGEKLASEFLHTKKWSDISFEVDGQCIFAHRLVLSCRCPVFSSMLSERFREGSLTDSSICIPNTTPETFLALLEYLYLDHAPGIELGDPVGILVLANQFCQPRLVTLAEYYITKGIEHSFQTKDKAEADIDVVEILYKAKDHNAHQLPVWCLHFIARHYGTFQARPEFTGLTEEHRTFVEDHQWPPPSYLRELAQYRAAKTKCSVM